MIQRKSESARARLDLLDQFAMAALAGGLEQNVESDTASRLHDNWWHPPEKIARRAYAIAHAMLTEREGW